VSVRVLLVSGRVEIEESLREDPGADAYWVERRPPELVVAAEAAREFAIAIVDFDTCPDPLSMARGLRANKSLEVIAIAGPEQERLAVESLRSGIYDYVLWPAAETLWAMLAGCAKKVKPAEPEFPLPFGRYTLLSRLGIGGMAEVFLADTGTPPRKIVVKRMLQSLAGDEFVAMFMDEARISSMLVHPNIVRVHDFGRVDESLYIAMEYVPGRNLEQLRLALAGPFPPAIACYIVAEMCAGLGHAHTKADSSGAHAAIVHRDVNPPNVLIADDGRVMITDFGIAKATHRYYETSSGTLKGKFEYMSPEQANGKAVDRRADIFCAGLVLYELLTGTRPFMAATPIETLFLIQECKPVAPSYWNQRLPKSLDDICMKALAKDPNARYSESAELERDLREFARGSMNPGPRDLATFTKSVARAEGEPRPEAPAPPPVAAAGPATTSDGKVTALLLHKKKKDVARPEQPPAKLSPLVAAVLEEETPARPTPVPRPAVAPTAAPSVPAAVVETEESRRPVPSRTITADAPAARIQVEATPNPSSSRDETVPGVLADLERLSASDVEAGEGAPRAGGTLIVPQESSAPRTPERTGSAELFPSAAKSQERTRLRLQLGGAVAGGLVVAVLTAVFVGPRVGSLFVAASPTPYLSSPTPFALVSATPLTSPGMRETAVAVESLAPSATPVASVSAVARVSPSPVPSRTVVAVVTVAPSPTQLRPVAKGMLSVWVDGWATVEIDGRPAGNAPFANVSLPAGRHRLVLTNAAKVRKEVDVVVQPGKLVKYQVSFD